MTGQREEPAPAEPPNGTRLSGEGTDMWLREDDADVETGVGHWWGAGVGQVYTWAEAYADGANPNARLYVVDPTDEAQVERVAVALSKVGGVFTDVRAAARVALRAITEEEKPNG